LAQFGDGVSSKRIDFNYNALAKITSISRYADLTGNNLVAHSTYLYDDKSRLVELNHTNNNHLIANYSWNYAPNNRLSQFISPDGVVNYSYDQRDQLLNSDYTYQSDENYSYDEEGNRTNNGYVTGTNNRLLTDGIYNYQSDLQGNRIKKTEIVTGKVTEYQWDNRNRLIAVIVRDNNGELLQQSEYIYDVYNRRLARRIDRDGSGNFGTERFVYDGDNVALIFDGAGALQQRLFSGTQVDLIWAQENSNGEVLWALSDNQGTVRDVIDLDGNVLNHITYDAFGNITSTNTGAIDFNWAYTGKSLDRDTGLYYYGNRYYDPLVGQFLSEDGMGLAAGDFHLYRYTFNSPVNYLDVSGNAIQALLMSPPGLVVIGGALVVVGIWYLINHPIEIPQPPAPETAEFATQTTQKKQLASQKLLKNQFQSRKFFFLSYFDTTFNAKPFGRFSFNSKS
jgi:RHS repeat-associated protein